MREPIPPTLEWRRGRVRLIDQRALPGRLCYVECASAEEVMTAIRDLVVRGAPAIGAAGAYGVALAAAGSDRTNRLVSSLRRTIRAPRPLASDVRRAARRLRAVRPTAVNLARGVDRALEAFEHGGANAALDAAHAIAIEDVAANRSLGAHGAELVGHGARVLTHCNAGALACVGYGTALGIVRAAAEAGKRPHVWVDETRPVLQGSRLTAWELDRLGIDHTLVADVAAGSLMAGGEVDLVVVGADRVAANGDVANKVGTYSLAVLARHHGVPFVVAAPIASVDLRAPSGATIEIEERGADEVTHVAGARIAPSRTRARNPAFDVTPAALVTVIVTERGVARPPFGPALAAMA